MSVFLQNGVEVLNVAVEMLLIFLYFSLLSEKRRGKFIMLLSYLVSSAAFSVAVILSDSKVLHLLVTVAVLIFVNFASFEDKFRHRAFLILIYLLTISIADPIVIGLLCVANMGSPDDFLQAGIGRYLGMMGTDIIYLWLIGLSHRIINKRIRDIPVQYWILIMIIPIISIFILQFMIDSITVDGAVTNYSAFIVALIGVAYINVAMFRFFESYEDKMKLQYLESLKQQEQENYKLLALSHKQVREMKHDIENQFSVLKELLEAGDVDAAKAYLIKLGSFVRLANRICYTGNNAVDSIVNIKGSLAQSYGIEFICKVNLITGIKADDMELCRIIGNGLDNAIEGCQRSGKANQHICFSIGEEREKLLLVISNTSSEVDTKALSSTKKDKGIHGIGINSIKSSVDRLNGLVQFSCHDGIFKLNIMVQNSLMI